MYENRSNWAWSQVRMNKCALRYESISPVQTDATLLASQQLPTLLDVTCCVRLDTLLHVVTCCCTKFETGQTFTYVPTEATTPNAIESCRVRLYITIKSGKSSQFVNETSVSSISTDWSIQSISIKSDLLIFIDLSIEYSGYTSADDSSLRGVMWVEKNNLIVEEKEWEWGNYLLLICIICKSVVHVWPHEMSWDTSAMSCL